MWSQMDFCTHCMVNILQNTSHRVNWNDIRYAMATAYLTVYPEKTMYSKVDGHQVSLHGNCASSDLYYVKRIGGQNKILWKLTFYTIINATAKTIGVENRPVPTLIVGLNLDGIPMKEGELKMRLFYEGKQCF
ncbi:MAG: hypothetical protein LBJ71_02760 [Holosporaceae bacterium]|jgi:hypothetical protein|nr:hypothetical protein [Holosporaceae bacterium]